MCGHTSLGIACYLVRAGLIEVKEHETEIPLDTPAGLIKLYVETAEQKPRKVRLINVPSYVLDTVRINVNGYGQIEAYIVYGGIFFMLIDLDSLSFEWNREKILELYSLARDAWLALAKDYPSLSAKLVVVRFTKRISKSPRILWYCLLWKFLKTSPRQISLWNRHFSSHSLPIPYR